MLAIKVVNKTVINMYFAPRLLTYNYSSQLREHNKNFILNELRNSIFGYKLRTD